MRKNPPTQASLPSVKFRVLKDGEYKVIEGLSNSVLKVVLFETITNRQSNVYFKFFDPSWYGFSELFVDGGLEISFQLGYADGPSSNWKTYIISYYDVEYLNNGAIVEVWAIDKAILGRTDISRSYGNKTVSEIVATILENNAAQWKSPVTGNVNSAIEETVGSFTVRQNNLSDIEFIRDILLPRAVSSSSGRGDFNLYFRNGDELHFRTPYYEKEVYATYEIAKGDKTGSSRFKYRSNFWNNVQCGGDLEVMGFDPLSKTVIQKNLTSRSNTDANLLLGKKKVSYNFAKGGSGRYICLPYKTDLEVESFAKQLWYSNDINSIIGWLGIKYDPDLDLARLVRVNLVNEKKTGSNDPLLVNGSGLYVVSSILTTLDTERTKYESEVILSRNSMDLGNSVPEGIAVVESRLPNAPKVAVTGDLGKSVDTYFAPEYKQKRAVIV